MELLKKLQYPGRGGLSGIPSRYLIKDALNSPRFDIWVRAGGREFHILDPLMERLSSYLVSRLLVVPLGSGGRITLLDWVRAWFLKERFKIFGYTLFLIFQKVKTMVFSLRLCKDKIWR